MDEYLKIQDLFRQGISQSEISHQLGVDRKTVHKYLLPLNGPLKSKHRPRTSLLDPFKDYLRKRLGQAYSNAEELLRKIKEKGYQDISPI